MHLAFRKIRREKKRKRERRSCSCREPNGDLPHVTSRPCTCSSDLFFFFFFLLLAKRKPTFCSQDRIPAASMASEAESEENVLRVGAIPAIDLRFLSQEDLNCLATLSDELRLLRRDDVVVPKIDRSVFNESAGSRRQTYSRLRLAQRKDEAVAVRGGRRRTGLLTVSRHPAGSVDKSGSRDNDLIVSLLRDLFSKENPASSTSKNGFPPRVSSAVEGMGARSIGTVGLLEDLSSRPRKRRRKDDARRKMQGSLSQGVRGERLDNGVSSSSAGAQNGVRNVLPLSSEDIFVAELNRRTAGLVSEADVIGFLDGLPGRWASRRKKKKFVEASDVREGLPKGWKILVGIRRKHGRVYVDCRKYIRFYIFGVCFEIILVLFKFSFWVPVPACALRL